MVKLSAYRSYLYRSSRSDHRGSALIPLMILATVSGIVLTASITLLLPILRSKDSRIAKGALNEVLSNFKQCIFTGYSWEQTILDNVNPAVIRCLTTGGCANGATAPIRLSLDTGVMCITQTDPSTGNAVGYDPVSNPKAGFTQDGRICSAFSKTNGVDSCPYRFEFNWVANCAGGAPCSDPSQTVIVSIRFSPSKSSMLRPLNLGDGLDRSKTFPGVQTYGLTRLSAHRDYGLAANYPGANGASVVRNQIETNSARPPLVLLEVMGSTLPPNYTCVAGGTAFNRLLNVVQADPSLALASGPNPQGVFTLNPGQYECDFSVPGYLANYFYTDLLNVTTNTVLITGSNGYSPGVLSFAQARSHGMGRFALSQASQIALRQSCSDAPTVAPANGYVLGVPTGTQAEVYAVLHCRSYSTN